jgi:hypothetical protein
VSAKVRLGLVWRETGAVRSGRPSRGQAASARKKRSGGKGAKPPWLRLEGELCESWRGMASWEGTLLIEN